MARSHLKIYLSFEDDTECLSDAERGYRSVFAFFKEVRVMFLCDADEIYTSFF